MVKRTIFEDISKTLSRGKSVLLLGPRQTGKTTLAGEFQFDKTISFLSSRLRQSYELDPDLVLREVAALKLKRPAKIFIDEVQKVPMIMDPIQLLIDQKKAQFFITGSSARKLKQQSDLNLLPGRVISYRLESFSLEEESMSSIESYLHYGSLPEISQTSEEGAKEDLLRTYVEVYLEEEIRKEAQLRKVPDFFRFLEHAASQAGQICSYAGIAQQIGVSHVTVKSYYEILESTLIADRIDPLSKSQTRKRLVKSPRYLFFDLGVRRLAAREGAPLPRQSLGLVFEQFVGLEILKFIRNHKKKATLLFWQDPEVAEVDWVIEKNNRYFPVEVKMTDRVSASDCKHLSTFMNEYPCPAGAFIVFSGASRQQITENVVAIPWNEIPLWLNELSL